MKLKVGLNTLRDRSGIGALIKNQSGCGVTRRDRVRSTDSSVYQCLQASESSLSLSPPLSPQLPGSLSSMEKHSDLRLKSLCKWSVFSGFWGVSVTPLQPRFVCEKIR